MFRALARLACVIGGCLLVADLVLPAHVETVTIRKHEARTPFERERARGATDDYRLRLAGGDTSSCQVDWAAYRDLKDGETIRIKTSALFGSCFSVATEHGGIHSFRWLNVALLAGGLVLLLVGIGVLPLGVLRESTD